jgi:Family of unknown function (DUF5302)
MAVEQSGTEASSGQPASAEDEAAPPGEAKPDLDEMKRKFREALERKRGTHASAEAVDHTGKVHGSHGPAASRRSFRRKSGG